MKKPKNLKNVEKKLAEGKERVELDDLLKFDFDYSDYSSQTGFSWEEMEASLPYRMDDALNSLSFDISVDIIGYGHASDILENANEEVFNRFAGISKDEDSSDESSSTTDRWDNYESVKDTVRQEIRDKMGYSDLVHMDSFKRLMKVLQEAGYKGDEAELEKYLKNSQEFRQYCQEKRTRYTG